MRYIQFVKALNAANAVRHCVKCGLKELGWEDFSITLSFEEEIDDGEEISDYSAFTYTCEVNGIIEYIALPMTKFVDNVDIFKISDIVKDYFIEEFSY